MYGGIQQIDPALLESAEEAIEEINSNPNLSDEDKKARVAAIQTQLAQIPQTKLRRGGYRSDGTPSNLSIVRTMRESLARRIALAALSGSIER